MQTAPPLHKENTAESISRKRNAAREQWPVSQEFYGSLVARDRTRTILPCNAHVRRKAVSWLLELCPTVKCSPATGSLAVVYYDAFVEWAYERPGATLLGCGRLVKWVLSTEMRRSSTYSESVCHELLIFACILLAAKRIEPRECACFECIEAEGCHIEQLKVPNQKTDQSSCPLPAPVHEMELIVLKALQWDTARVSAHDFFHFWVDSRSTIGEAAAASKLQEICYITIDACIREASFASMPARVLAVSAIIWACGALDLKVENVDMHVDNGVLEDLESTVAQIGHLWLEHQLSDKTSLVLEESFVPDLQVSLPAANPWRNLMRKQPANNVPQRQQKKRKCTFVGTGQQIRKWAIMVSCNQV